MTDDSHLDARYFIDPHVYNCPFCKRRNVTYSIDERTSFNWTADKICYTYFVICGSCDKKSMHLSFSDIYYDGYRRFRASIDIDEEIFYSVPTSFFVLDDRIPRVLREQITEAEGCLKSNYLTGASACARKAVYELAQLEKGSGAKYDERIRSLKIIRPDVPSVYFDTLLAIQEATSDKVHEESFDGWRAEHLRLILATLKEILTELYVVPKERERNRAAILKLKGSILQGKRTKTATEESPDESTSGE